MNSEEKNKVSKKFSMGTGMVIGISILYILLGLAMVLLDGFKDSYIIYICSFVLDIFGIILIVKYCLSGGFKDIGKFEFSGGVLCVLAGILMIIRVSQITKFFFVFLGICILLTAIVKLQNAVDMRALDHSAWFIFLILAMLFLALAIVIILNPGEIVDKHYIWLFYLLVIDGAFSLFSTVYLSVVLMLDKKREKANKEKESTAEDSPMDEIAEKNPVPEEALTDPAVQDEIQSEKETELPATEDLTDGADTPSEQSEKQEASLEEK